MRNAILGMAIVAMIVSSQVAGAQEQGAAGDSAPLNGVYSGAFPSINNLRVNGVELDIKQVNNRDIVGTLSVSLWKCRSNDPITGTVENGVVELVSKSTGFCDDARTLHLTVQDGGKTLAGTILAYNGTPIPLTLKK